VGPQARAVNAALTSDEAGLRRWLQWWSVSQVSSLAEIGGRPDLFKYVMVGIGGFIGAIARFVLGSYIGNRFGTRFPYGTFVINMSGSFLLGMVMAVLTQKTDASPNWRYLVPIGFIGAYTTFSTFEYETLRTVQDGQMLMAFANVALSIIVGFGAVWAGILVGRTLS
jgi:CrcB protein